MTGAEEKDGVPPEEQVVEASSAEDSARLEDDQKVVDSIMALLEGSDESLDTLEKFEKALNADYRRSAACRHSA